MKKTGFEIPPHANALPHRRFMKRFKAMSAEERRKTLVDSGVLTKKGNLAKRYQPSAKEKS